VLALLITPLGAMAAPAQAPVIYGDGLLPPPVVMERSLWPGLESLEGDVGCRRLIRAQPQLVAALPAPAAGHHPVDVDTPADYRRLLQATATEARPSM